jgi:hypothetical protein
MEADERVRYQEGRLASVLPLTVLLKGLEAVDLPFADGTLM